MKSVAGTSVFALVIGACSGSAPRGQFDEKLKAVQESELREALQASNESNWLVAEDKLRKFLTQYPVSPFNSQARYELGLVVKSRGQMEQAAEIFKNLSESARSAAPLYAGLALERLAECYETLGDELGMASALNDAEQFSEFLPREVAEIEIPARKAALALRRHHVEEARREIRRVDLAFPSIFPGNDVRPEDQARILYSIGAFPVDELTAEHFFEALSENEELQKYLWRASQLQAAPWSQKAMEKLRTNYQTFFDFADNFTDKGAVGDRRMKMLGSILESIQTLTAYAGSDWAAARPPAARPPAATPATAATATGDATGSIETIEKIKDQCRAEIWGGQPITPVTPESRGRKFPQRNKKPAKTVPKETVDPNLLRGFTL
ncbi:MAG: hypothetical protein C5B49_00750 [Bdellovibrio sp.]|nr:MAG: hypothetical protein C5B49_00750 [Bdellovibrio sp.]